MLTSLPSSFQFPGLQCAAEEPLLNGVNPVPDSYFSASSEYDGYHAAPNARLDGNDTWWASRIDDRTAIPLTMYLQVSKVCMTYLLLLFSQLIVTKVRSITQ